MWEFEIHVKVSFVDCTLHAIHEQYACLEYAI